MGRDTMSRKKKLKVFYCQITQEIGIGDEFGQTIWFDMPTRDFIFTVTVLRDEHWIMIGDFE